MNPFFLVPSNGTVPAQNRSNPTFKPYGTPPAVEPESLIPLDVFGGRSELARVDSNHHRRFQRPVSCH